MTMKYYVLWIKDNPIIQKYQDLYYKKLISRLEQIHASGYVKDIIIDLLQSLDNRDFILNGEVSSLINILFFEIIEGKSFQIRETQYFIEQFEQEVRYYLLGEFDKLSMNTWDKIGDTNIRISLHDLNPWGYHSAHPDHEKTWGTVTWWEKTPDDWREVYEKTFQVVKEIDEGVYDELNHMIHKVVPFGTARWLHNSCSHRDCIGNLYLWYTIDVNRPELNNVEAVIHESSHNKLNLIMQHDPLILNDLTEKYYSPYRPDARHIHGIYLGIHAFVPVIYILMKAYAEWYMWESEDWLEKIVLYYLKNKFTYKVLLKHGNFTELGQEILDEVYEVMCMTDTVFLSIPWWKDALFKVKEYQRQHFQDVNINYPHLQY